MLELTGRPPPSPGAQLLFLGLKLPCLWILDRHQENSLQPSRKCPVGGRCEQTTRTQQKAARRA